MLLLSDPDVKTLKVTIREQAWAAQAYAGCRAQVQAWLACPLHWPAGWGGHYHNYFCPAHGVPLAFDPEEATFHRCPVDGEPHQGELIAAAWGDAKRQHSAGMAANAALLLRLGEELPGARERVAEVLRHAAASAAAFLPHHTGIGLMEATWLIPLLCAYDWSREALPLPAEERRRLEHELFDRTAEWLRHRPGSPNMEAWYAAAVGLAGVLLNRPDFTAWSIGEFDRILDRWVLPDGGWIERSPGYATYTLAALFLQAEGLRAAGVDLYARSVSRKSIKSLVDWLLAVAYPNGQLPAVNDFWFDTYLSARELELAYARYRDPRYAACLRTWGIRPDGSDGPPASGRRPEPGAQWFQAWALLPWQLLFGVPELPVAVTGDPGHVGAADPGGEVGPAASGGCRATLLPQTGFAVLAGPGEEPWVLFDFSADGGHGHPSTLNVSLYGGGRPLAADAGTTGYGLRLVREWYQHSAAHNVVVIDGQPQKLAGYGVLDLFGSASQGAAASALTTTAYPGVVWRRTLLFLPPALIVIDRLVSATGPHVFDWLWHAAGELQVEEVRRPAEPAPALPAQPYLRGVAGVESSGAWALHWAAAADAARAAGATAGSAAGAAPGTTLSLIGGPGGGAVYVAEAPGTADRPYCPRPVAIVRQQGDAALFAHVLFVSKHGPGEAQAEFSAAGAGHPVHVRLSLGDRTWYAIERLTPAAEADPATGAAWPGGASGSRAAAAAGGFEVREWLETDGRVAWVERRGGQEDGIVVDGTRVGMLGKPLASVYRCKTPGIPAL